MMTYAIRYDAKDTSPELQDELLNETGVPLQDMSVDAFTAIAREWDSAIDGRWPPVKGSVVRMYPRGDK